MFKWYLHETALFCRMSKLDVRHDKLNFARLPSALNLAVKNCLPNDNQLHTVRCKGNVIIVKLPVILLKT
jgi:hypothetical protein